MVWPAPRIWSTHGETNDSNLSANTSHAADDRQLRQLHRLTHLAVPTGPVSFEERHPPDPLGEYLRATMRGGASDDGMLARFGLLVWPEAGGKWKNIPLILKFFAFIWLGNYAVRHLFEALLPLISADTESAAQRIETLLRLLYNTYPFALVLIATAWFYLRLSHHMGAVANAQRP